MYKLLIVDDDEMIRNGIKNAIPWADYGINEVRTAENGEAGEQIFITSLPDIVLTDIRMPKIDGLELIHRINKIKSNTKIIILSGYDDFSYAQMALKQGAFDYLLKTADMDELLKVINKAIVEINNERQKDDLYLKLRQQLNMSLPLLRHRYLNELIHGSVDLGYLKKKMEFVDLKFDCDCFMVMVAEVDDFSLLCENISEEERLILKFRVMHVIEELFDGLGICFESKYEEFVFIYNCDDNLSVDANKQRLIEKCEEASNIVLKSLNLSISIGLSSIGYTLTSIKSCYEDAKKALEHKLYCGKGSIIDIKDISSYTSIGFKMDYDVENKLISSLRVGEKKTVLMLIEEIFEQIKYKRNLGIGNFQRVCIELISIASRVLCEFDVDIAEIYGKEFLYFEEIKKYKNFDDAKQWMLYNFEKVADYILKTKVLKAKKIIETAKKYIGEHYNEDLSLNKIADLVHMSPNYFSSMFSTEVGQSFLEYVIMRRIEKAKLLLGKKDSRASEVGEIVGYDNPYYFSRIFKKYTGLSPMEYKESLK